MIETKWIVITGAPSCGKTTTVQALSEALGHPVREEIATQVIRRRMAVGKTLAEATADQHDLQGEIFSEGQASEEGLQHHVDMILDRGWPDVIAYELLYDGGRAEAFLELVRTAQRRYRKVFRLERLPLEQNDVRIEDDALASRLHDLYAHVYEQLGYEVIDVPVLSVQERVTLLLSHL